MPERQIIASPIGDLRFEFAWRDASATENFGPAYGELAIWLRGTRVWGTDSDGIVGHWVELLEYLGNYWLYLVLDVENDLRRPFQQGHALANWLRQKVAGAGGRIDPESLLADCGVPAAGHDFSTRRLDAVAFWAHGRRPAILWNTSEKHRSNEGARRATLAHEICHLLVDRQEALPLSAVVGGAMDRRLEQRANAFAAELLCPRQEAGAEYRRMREVGAALSNLTHRFGVSKELASLQLARSGAVDDVNHQRELEQSGPPDASYPWDRR